MKGLVQMRVIGYRASNRDTWGNDNDKTESRLISFLFFFFFLPLPAGIDSLVSGMSQDLAVKRLRNY